MLRPRRVKGTVRTIRIQAYSFHITHDQNWQACIFATTFRSLVFGWIYTFSLVFELDQYFERLRVVYLNVLLHKKYIQNTSIIWWASKKSFLWIKTSTFSSHSLSVHFTYFFLCFFEFSLFFFIFRCYLFWYPFITTRQIRKYFVPSNTKKSRYF